MCRERCFIWHECVDVRGILVDGRKAEKVARDADVDFMLESGAELERMMARECVELAYESRARRDWALRSAMRFEGILERRS